MSQPPPVPTLLVVHHTTSPALESMLDAVLAGTRADGIDGVDVVVRPALAATASDLLAAGAVLLGTPANIGYMSGALKHFFDQVYYPCLHATVGTAYGLYVHGNLDTVGAARSVHAIATGLQWRRAADDVVVLGPPDAQALESCWNLGATLAASLMPQ
ncbi:MAG TPA: flavodoxin [Dermatophilaceae bacterium]|nr:flavodoxin [Dermatophilaceae bacterium]